MATHTTHRLSPLAVACMVMAGSFGPVVAPLTAAQEATLEEVIVTARKRDENNRGSGIFKTAAIYVLRKEKRLLTTGQITR